MSGRGFIQEERPQQCDLCGRIQELRPYGPNGECICFDCMKQDEKSAQRRFREHVQGEPQAGEGGSDG